VGQQIRSQLRFYALDRVGTWDFGLKKASQTRGIQRSTEKKSAQCGRDLVN